LMMWLPTSKVLLIRTDRAISICYKQATTALLGPLIEASTMPAVLGLCCRLNAASVVGGVLLVPWGVSAVFDQGAA
jgi:hypothetical protein